MSKENGVLVVMLVVLLILGVWAAQVGLELQAAWNDEIDRVFSRG